MLKADLFILKQGAMNVGESMVMSSVDCTFYKHSLYQRTKID